MYGKEIPVEKKKIGDETYPTLKFPLKEKAVPITINRKKRRKSYYSDDQKRHVIDLFLDEVPRTNIAKKSENEI